MMHRACLLLAILLPVFFLRPAPAAVGGGDITFKPDTDKPVFFSHEKHVDEKKKKCSACHYHVFQMEKGSYKMDMSKITKGEFCGICHNGKRSFDVKDKSSCDKCHK